MMILQLGVVTIFAKTEIVTLKGIDYTSGSPSEVKSEVNAAMIRPSKPVGWKVTLPYTTSAVKIKYRTADPESGIVRVRLDNQTGEILGSLETYKTPHSWGDWTETYEKTIAFSRPVSGDLVFWLTVEVPNGGGGAHWIHELSFVEYDTSQALSEFNMDDIFEDIKDVPNKHEINLLTDLGLFDKNEKKFDPYKPLTRIEFVSLLGKLIEAEKYSTEESPFFDIAAGSENADLLSGLYHMGIIKGDTDGNFRPNSFIKPIEAATVCVNSLGYESFAKDANVMMDLANSLDLFDGLKLTDKVTKSEGAKLIYNLLLSDYLAVQEMSSEGIFYNPTKNFLEKSTSYKHTVGVMTADYLTGLYTPGRRDFLKIDDKEYKVISGINTSYLGFKCELFYHEENGENILDAIRPVPKAEWNVVSSGPDVKFDVISETELKYTLVSEDEEYEYEFDSKCAIIYNGTALSKSLKSLISNPSNFEGSITTIDNNADGIIETVWIEHVSQIMKFGAASNGKISDELSKTLYNTRDKDFALFVSNRAVALEDVESGIYFTVMESSGSGEDKYVRAIACDNTVSGKITSYSNGKYTIDGTEYLASTYCKDELYVGLEGTFTLDRFNYILCCEEGAVSETKVGLYLAHDRNSDTELDSEAKIKVVTETGVEEFKIAKKVIADGVTVKTVDHFYDGTGAFKGLTKVAEKSPVLYRLNASDEIVMIDTINDGTLDKNDQLHNLDDVDDNPINSIIEGSYYVYNKTLATDAVVNSKYGLKSDAKVLSVRKDGTDSEHKIMTGLAASDYPYSLAPYSTKRGSKIADIILLSDYVSIVNTKGNAFILNSITEAVDAEGNVTKKLSGYSSSAEAEYFVDTEKYSSDPAFKTKIDSLEKGNLIRPFLTNSKVTDVDLIYIPAGNAFGPQTNNDGVNTILNENVRNASGSHNSGRIFLGKFIGIEDIYAIMDIEEQDENSIWQSRPVTFNAAAATVIVCEKLASGKYIFSYGRPMSAMAEGDIIVAERGGSGAITRFFVFRDSSQ